MPSDGATNYIIYYREIYRGRRLPLKELTAAANDTNITISLDSHLLSADWIHYISIFASNTQINREIIGYRGFRSWPITLNSPSVGPVNITLGMVV